MIGTIRKHQQWLWAIIITAVIISFLYWNGSRGGSNAGMRDTGDFGSVGGEKVTKEDYVRARNECLLQYFFMSGGSRYNEQEAKKNNYNLEQRLYVRLLLIQKEEQQGIRVSSEKAGQYATRMIQQVARGNQISTEEFKKYVLDAEGLTMDDMDRFVRHELGIQELMSTVGLGGALVTPQEAQELYRREHQELSAEAVLFSVSNYLAEVKVTPEALGQFYTNQMANYRLPVRMQVAYVRFPYTNYFAKVEKESTNLNERVETAYKQLGTNTLQDAKTPEETKAKIRDQMLRMAAAVPARNDANQFAGPLFDNNPPPLADFSKLAKSKELTVAVTEPFARGETPKGLDVGPDFAKAAFNLSPKDQPYSQPIMGKDGVYVLAFEKSLPEEIPSLEQIKDKVTSDYKMIQATMQARRAGMEFSQSVSNGVAQGKAFDAIAAEAKVKPVQLPPFSLSTREITNLDEVPLESFREVAFSTQPGKISPFRPTREGGFIVYVKSKLPVDETKMKSDLPGFTAYVRQTREREAFDSWFRREFERAHIDAPFIRQQQEEMRKAQRT